MNVTEAQVRGMWGRSLLVGAISCMAGAGVHAADMVTKAPPVTAQAEKSWLLTFDTDVRYFSWERTRGNFPGDPNTKGSQTYVPVALQLVTVPTNDLKLEYFARGGYVRTSRSTDPGIGLYMTGSVGTMTDTVVGFTGTYTGWAGVQPFYSLNVNLPTGSSVQFGPSAIARTDPDLVDVPAFGVGLNVGNTVGLTFAFANNLALTLSAGHTARGGFDRDALGPLSLLGLDFRTDRLEPGDNLTGTANLAFSLGNFSGNISGSVSREDASQFNGVVFFKTGTAYLVSGVGAYRWDDVWTSTLVASYAHSERVMVADPFTGLLLAEQFNSNSNLYRVSFDQSMSWSQWLFNVTVNYLYRDNNSYDPMTMQFVPAKTKVGVGGGAKYALSDMISLGARVERFWVDENENPGNFLPAMKYEGWMVSGGGVFRF